MLHLLWAHTLSYYEVICSAVNLTLHTDTGCNLNAKLVQPRVPLISIGLGLMGLEG